MDINKMKFSRQLKLANDSYNKFSQIKIKKLNLKN